jgi:hypothetical protein
MIKGRKGNGFSAASPRHDPRLWKAIASAMRAAARKMEEGL